MIPVLYSVNQRAPSGPSAMSSGSLPRGSGYSVMDGFEQLPSPPAAGTTLMRKQTDNRRHAA